MYLLTLLPVLTTVPQQPHVKSGAKLEKKISLSYSLTSAIWLPEINNINKKICLIITVKQAYFFHISTVWTIQYRKYHMNLCEKLLFRDYKQILEFNSILFICIYRFTMLKYFECVNHWLRQSVYKEKLQWKYTSDYDWKYNCYARQLGAGSKLVWTLARKQGFLTLANKWFEKQIDTL